MGAAEDKPSSCPTCSQIFPNLEAANNGLSPHAATFCNTAYETPYPTRTSKSLMQPTGRSAQGIILKPGKKWSHVRAGSYDLMHESCPARMCLRPNQMSMRTWLLYLSTRSSQVLPAAIYITMKVTHPNPDCRSLSYVQNRLCRRLDSVPVEMVPAGTFRSGGRSTKLVAESASVDEVLVCSRTCGTEVTMQCCALSVDLPDTFL